MYLTWSGGGRRAGRYAEHGRVRTPGVCVLTLLLWKPTAWIRPFSVASSVCRVAAGWRQGGGRVVARWRHGGGRVEVHHAQAAAAAATPASLAHLPATPGCCSCLPPLPATTACCTHLQYVLYAQAVRTQLEHGGGVDGVLGLRGEHERDEGLVLHVRGAAELGQRLRPHRVHHCRPVRTQLDDQVVRRPPASWWLEQR